MQDLTPASEAASEGKYMDKKVKGSWLIHHTNKLQSQTSQSGYENTFLAGKAGILLSAISSNNDTTISSKRLETLALAANINTTFELPKLLDVLSNRELIDSSASGVSVLGITTSSTLQHTSDIFDSLSPAKLENAAIQLAECASIAPINGVDAAEELADNYKLARAEVAQALFDAEQIGFVDVEKLGENEKLLFNGNLFRRQTTLKIKLVLDSLSAVDQTKLNELTESLKKMACISKQVRSSVEAQLSMLNTVILGEYFSKSDVAKTLFSVARELEQLAMQRTFTPHSAASLELRGVLSCLLDYWGIDRVMFSNVCKAEN